MNKMIKTLADVVALGGAIMGSFLVAANMGMAAVGYLFYLASSVAGVYLLVKAKDGPKALILQNLFFIGVNIFGLIRHGS